MLTLAPALTLSLASERAGPAGGGRERRGLRLRRARPLVRHDGEGARRRTPARAQRSAATARHPALLGLLLPAQSEGQSEGQGEGQRVSYLYICLYLPGLLRQACIIAVDTSGAARDKAVELGATAAVDASQGSAHVRAQASPDARTSIMHMPMRMHVHMHVRMHVHMHMRMRMHMHMHWAGAPADRRRRCGACDRRRRLQGHMRGCCVERAPRRTHGPGQRLGLWSGSGVGLGVGLGSGLGLGLRRMVQVGLPLGGEPPVVPMARVAGREIEIIGSHGLDAADMPAILQLVACGRLDPG